LIFWAVLRKKLGKLSLYRKAATEAQQLPRIAIQRLSQREDGRELRTYDATLFNVFDCAGVEACEA